MGAFTAVAESSPSNAPATASAISTATPSYKVPKGKRTFMFINYVVLSILRTRQHLKNLLSNEKNPNDSFVINIEKSLEKARSSLCFSLTGNKITSKNCSVKNIIQNTAHTFYVFWIRKENKNSIPRQILPELLWCLRPNVGLLSHSHAEPTYFPLQEAPL